MNNHNLLAGHKHHQGIHPGVPSHEGDHTPSQRHQQRQIKVNSTIDADIVLRRVIEDRAAIIALKSRLATNEAELMKAKSRRRHIARILNRQDQEIANLTTKAKRELAEYNEKSKQYIHSFVLAFENGDMDKLPRHPFVPPLEELEQAINRRKATLIEKVQADDRAKKLEVINSQERVTMKVLKKNEEAFLRAIEIAKQQFSDSCETWFNRVNKLLTVMPHYSHGIGGMEMEAAVQEPEMTFAYPSPKKCAAFPQHDRARAFGQDLKMSSQDENFMTPLIRPPTKRSIDIAQVSPERTAKRPMIGNFRPMCAGFPGGDGQHNFLQPKRRTDHLPNPTIAYHDSNDCGDAPLQQRCVEPKNDDESVSIHQQKTSDNQDEDDEMSVARLLTNLHEDKNVLTSPQRDTFAVPNI
ncbi:hypothetical protein ACHAXR_009058 [Thalassiosira sp. AJA248-18]